MKNPEWAPASPEICPASTLLTGEYGLNPFDAHHAAAIARDKGIPGSGHVYDAVRGVGKIGPREFIKT